MNWKPSASITALRQRQRIIQKIRCFFEGRGYCEVDTPLLGRYGVTDPYIDSFTTQSSVDQSVQYLQTSPEYFMKRLLASGSGPIFQICKAFRQEEEGRQHNPEFSLLEFYQPGFTHLELMEEVDTLLQHVLKTPPAARITYAELFQRHLNIDPHKISLHQLQQRTQSLLSNDHDSIDRDTCLQLLLTHEIEPQMSAKHPLFITDFPASQAALAKISTQQPPVAERFELYYQGMELANGFHELTDAKEQQQRFQSDQHLRQAQQKAVPSIDSKFIDCLTHLPPCAGVAIGIDRLIMLALETDDIRDVLSFAWEQR